MNFGSSFKKFATELSWSLRIYKPSHCNGLLGAKFPPVAALNENDDSGLKSKAKSLVPGIHVKNNFDFLKVKTDLERKVEKHFCIIPKTDKITIKKIIEPQKSMKINIELPLKDDNKEIDLPCSNLRELIEPVGNVVSKQAAILVRIRRKKMRKHKYKKFIKKMKAEFSKRKQRRQLEKEKAFQKGLSAILKQAEDYDPKQLMKETLEKVHWEPPITRVRGILAPKWVIKEHLENEREKKLVEERIAECLREKK